MAILAVRELGAERIIAMSRHPERQKLARYYGATDIFEGRGESTDEHAKLSPAQRYMRPADRRHEHASPRLRHSAASWAPMWSWI
jgi:threonine dehydrogenase-like Zn-dependent dehydrogenase